MGTTYRLEFKWTTSRGRDTYGYNICSLWVNNSKKASCNGGGYDMQGTVFADWLMIKFEDRIKQLQGYTQKSRGQYGIVHYNKKTKKSQKHSSKHTNTTLDGACGFSTMQKLAERIGVNLQYAGETKNSAFYIATDIKP